MKFLRGAYGFDILSIFLIFLSTLLSLFRFTSLLSILILFIALFRIFSKQTYQRSSELLKFISLCNNILGKFGKRLPSNLPRLSMDNLLLIFQQYKYKYNQNKNFKIVKCPQCGQSLRLPKGKGKILVTCKKCSHEFRMKS